MDRAGAHGAARVFAHRGDLGAAAGSTPCREEAHFMYRGTSLTPLHPKPTP